MGDIEQRSEGSSAPREDGEKTVIVRIAPSIADVPADEWDACARGTDSTALSGRAEQPVHFTRLSPRRWRTANRPRG